MTHRWNRNLAMFVAGVLGADAIAHIVWTTGVTWPAGNVRALSYALLGAELPFTPRVLLPLSAALFVAAAAVWCRAALGRRHRLGWWWHTTTLLVAGAAAARATAGIVWAFDVGTPLNYPAFYWLNLCLYTPLCIALSVAAFKIARHENQGRKTGARAMVAIPVAATALLLFGAYGWAPDEEPYTPAEMNIESRYIDTDLARFHYTRQGSGPAVVLLSPGAGWLFAWQEQAQALSADHTVYVVDLPGQGFTTLHDQDFAFDLAAMTSAVETFLNSVELGSVALAGNSWSGGWALAFAQRHPERVDRLMLLAPSGADKPDPASWELFKPPLVGELLANLSAADRELSAAAVKALYVNQELATQDVLDAMWKPGTFADNQRSLYLLERGLDWRETQLAMPQTTQPTLIIWGAQDTVLPVGYADVFTHRMPDTDLRILEGCGHALTLDCAPRVNELMTGFLK